MPTDHNIKQTRIIAVMCLLSVMTGLAVLINTKIVQLIFHMADSAFSKSLDRSYWINGINCAATDIIIAGSAFSLYYFYPSISRGKTFFIMSTAFVLHFYYEVIINAVNMPLCDDFGSVMTFLNKFYMSGSMHEKISLLGSQFFETRLVVFRGICLAYTGITGEINFSALLFISSLFILGIAFVFSKSVKLKGDRKYLLFSIIIILLFQFQYHSGIFFLTGGMPKFCTLFFSIAVFYFLPINTKASFILSLLCAILASLSFGNGILCFLLGILFLLNNKRYRLAGIWSLISLLFLFGYFHNYSFILSENLSLHSIKWSFLYGLVFLGNSMQFLSSVNFPLITGIMIWCILILLTVKKYYKQNPAIYCTLVFIVLSSMLAAPFRLHETEGLERAMFTSYGIYSMAAICCCVTGLMELFTSENNHAPVMGLVIVALVYHLGSDMMFFPEVNVRKTNLRECVYPWLKYTPADGAPACSYFIADPDNAGIIISQSEKLNIYHLPDL